MGKVNGDATSTLQNCTVSGSVFGAGYSASVPTASVYPGNFVTEPHYNSTTGVFEKGVFPIAEQYLWSNDKGSTSNTLVDENGSHYIFVDRTKVNLNELGTVSGAVTLNLNGSTTVAGNVYGGGDESAVNNTNNPAYASTTVNLKGNTIVDGNVYGGGNQGSVSGNTTVTIEN